MRSLTYEISLLKSAIVEGYYIANVAHRLAKNRLHQITRPKIKPTVPSYLARDY